jgi:hypothetical protein
VLDPAYASGKWSEKAQHAYIRGESELTAIEGLVLWEGRAAYRSQRDARCSP